MDAAVDLGGALLVGVAVLCGTAIAVGGLRLASPVRWRELTPKVAERAGALDPRGCAVTLAIAVGIVAVSGSAFLLAGPSPDALVINEEQSLPAYFNAAQLYLGGILALGLCSVRPAGEAAWPWMLLGVLLIALGFDEAAELHERLESRSGLPAAVVLAPVALAGLAAFAGLFGHLRRCPPALGLFVAGAVAWATSQALDPIHSVDWKSAVEETLELGGTALFVLALQRVAHARRSAT